MSRNLDEVSIIHLLGGDFMLFKELGKTGEKIPALGLGTWGIGGFETPDYSKDGEYVHLVKKAIEMGYKHIDTAEYYASGHTEEIVGKAIGEFNRSDLFIVSKVWSNHLREKDLLKSLERSLTRLQTDYIDLYLIHWPNPDIPLEETLNAMAKAVDDGMVRYVGVSNFDRKLLEEAINKSKVPIVCDQVLYNVEEREPERNGLLEFCQREGVTLTAYSPLNRGILSLSTKSVLEDIAKDHGITIFQLMLAWLLSKERVVTIPKAGSIKHLEENLKAVDIRLTAREIEMIDKVKD